jgi:hypothetical protein
MTQMLSAMPIKRIGSNIKPKEGMRGASSAATEAIAGPAISDVRVPSRSRTTPLMGMPISRPTDNAVIIWAAIPAEI